jgi:oxalate decarboxylase/phosphoglucose isomerase-like protein (cupin superfamily)
MAEATTATKSPALDARPLRQRPSPYQQWMAATGIPIHRGFYMPDLRTIEVAPWGERGCNACFLEMVGSEGFAEARVTEIPPARTLPPLKFALDEAVYVLEGRGTTTVWTEGAVKKTFEWQKHSLFMLPHGSTHQITNMQGDRPARLLHYNYLPLSMSALPDPTFFFNNQHAGSDAMAAMNGDFYSEAQVVKAAIDPKQKVRSGSLWYGNFFPDMRAWDRLNPFWGRGAGGTVVSIQFPGSQMSAHMSVFPAQTYKKGHRHGPAYVIVIPTGEGYSIMWQEGKEDEKVIIPWQEASIFVPPFRWFHQHFNVGKAPARYLAFHPLPQLMGSGEQIQDRTRDQFEYANEYPEIRQRFEAEMEKRGMKSLMPEEAYTNPNYEWDYGGAE